MRSVWGLLAVKVSSKYLVETYGRAWIEWEPVWAVKEKLTLAGTYTRRLKGYRPVITVENPSPKFLYTLNFVSAYYTTVIVGAHEYNGEFWLNPIITPLLFIVAERSRRRLVLKYRGLLNPPFPFTLTRNADNTALFYDSPVSPATIESVLGTETLTVRTHDTVVNTLGIPPYNVILDGVDMTYYSYYPAQAINLKDTDLLGKGDLLFHDRFIVLNNADIKEELP